MKKCLITWIGTADLKAITNSNEYGLGPIGQAITELSFDEIVLISDWPPKESARYLNWIKSFYPNHVELYSVKLSGPTNFGQIYETAVRIINDTLIRNGLDTDLFYHLSPGTPAMAAVWIIVAKTRFTATLIESSLHKGVKIASVPFDISAEYIPDLLRKPDEHLNRLAAGLPPEQTEFSKIIHRSALMKRVIAKARHIAPRSIPVLIEGESGTGKELLARAIHNSSPRKEKPFIAVNCGAIPEELVESSFFGYEKGAFTGANQQKTGYFEAADSGTLFLDEIGELATSAQAKLLRALQEGEILRVGGNKPVTLNVRVIAATNKNLIEEVAADNFRPDLFYRIAVAVLKLPPLRERAGDISLLVNHLIDQINEESKNEPGFKTKGISLAAKNLLFQYNWPGNIRELQNTLTRSLVWCEGEKIEIDDVRDAILSIPTSNSKDLLNFPIAEGVNLPDLISELVQHYILKALKETRNNKTKAASILGLPNYQTLTNWMKKYKIRDMPIR